MAKKRANGEGNIRKRKDGRWEGRYTAGYDERTGKRLIKNVLGKTQAEVKEKLAKAVAEADTVNVRRVDEYTLGTWLQTWYELYAKPHLRFSTAEYYRRGIELHIAPRIGDIPLKKLTGRDLQGLYKDLREHGRLREAQKGKQPGLSDSTIRGIYTMQEAIRRMTSQPAARMGLVGRGSLQKGNYADILVFDPKKFTDHATFTNPAQKATGLDWCIVNGQVAIDHDRRTTTGAGMVLTG